MPTINSKSLNSKYAGKEVICDAHKNARIDELTGYCIRIKADDGCWLYDTGTGENDNAVAKGYLRFADGTLQREFLEEYGQYVNSEEGRFEAWEYYFLHYD